jgi:hypothetical protein
VTQPLLLLLLAVSPRQTFAQELPRIKLTAGMHRIDAEVDLLLEVPGQGLWAIEIKRAANARPRRGFHSACDDIQPARRLLVHAGDERYPIGDGVEAVGLRLLAEELRRLSCVRGNRESQPWWYGSHTDISRTRSVLLVRQYNQAGLFSGQQAARSCPRSPCPGSGQSTVLRLC